ncbi:olfactory receptor-like protein COR4 [Aquarana catesbeiana]|uniref:olfactory receptor-like protein COR4 n=1 Tax=Aquarana catesbeiana TaxID=8400 RepID=UPI003CC9DE09
MCDNGTTVTEFFMIGFRSISDLKILLFILLLITYILILFGNVFIILLVSTCHHLNVPMYIFLRNLSLADVLFTTNIMPKMLHVILKEGSPISTTGCLIQYYVYLASTYTQSLILTVMAFDRYLAICHPLRYPSIMNQNLCCHLVYWPWAICFLLLQTEIAFLLQVKFCGSNIIEHFYCDFVPILAIASSDTSTVETEDFVFGIPFMFLPFIFVTASYLCILVSIFKMTSIAGRWKAFSTCSAHLATILIFFVTQITIYTFPVGNETFQGKTVKYLLYTVLTPFINPILYSMRNHEIKRAILQLFFVNNTK